MSLANLSFLDYCTAAEIYYQMFHYEGIDPNLNVSRELYARAPPGLIRRLIFQFRVLLLLIIQSRVPILFGR